mgnify:CR=1 FL=1
MTHEERDDLVEILNTHRSAFDRVIGLRFTRITDDAVAKAAIVVADADVDVLILGETGTGKELMHNPKVKEAYLGG